MKTIRLMPGRLHVYPLYPRSKSPIYIPEASLKGGDTKIFTVLGVAPDVKDVKPQDWVVWKAYGKGPEPLRDGTRIIKIEDETKRAAQLKQYADGFAAVAAPVISRNEDECTQLLRLLDAEDQENIIVRQMCARLRNRINEMRKQRAECFAEELPE